MTSNPERFVNQAVYFPIICICIKFIFYFTDDFFQQIFKCH